MSSPADPFSILSKNPQVPGFRKPEAKPKIQRYRRGQGPEREDQDDDDNDDIYPISHYTVENSDAASVAESSFTTSKNEEDEIKARLNKRRQTRRTVIVEENAAKDDEPKKVQEKPKEAIIEEEDEEVENAARRRALLKEKLLEQEKLNAEQAEFQGMEEEEEEEIDDEEEDTQEEGGIVSMLKPIFVSKNQRETNDKKIEEEIALKEEENKIKEKRKLEAKMMFLEAVRKDDEAEKDEDNLSQGNMPDDDDTYDEADQYVQWKIRELKRIKREREERFKRDKDRAEIERRRRLTDTERAHEDKILGSDDTEKKPKVQLKFMQKYYHKGAFYQDSDDPLFKRDYNLAVGEDMWDKSDLPKILQVRRGQFGMAGASKYTHLNDQDTTNFDPQYRVNELIQDKTKSKLGGFKGADTMDRPSAKKR